MICVFGIHHFFMVLVLADNSCPSSHACTCEDGGLINWIQIYLQVQIKYFWLQNGDGYKAKIRLQNRTSFTSGWHHFHLFVFMLAFAFIRKCRMTGIRDSSVSMAKPGEL